MDQKFSEIKTDHRRAGTPIPAVVTYLSQTSSGGNRRSRPTMPLNESKGSLLVRIALCLLLVAALAAGGAGCKKEKSKPPAKAAVVTGKCETGPCKPDMCYVPAGRFYMGCSPGDKDCAYHEKPAKQVNLSKGYCVDKYEVSQEDFEIQMDYLPGENQDCPDCPVGGVTYNVAKEYCKAAGKRLPTEAEWEKAARAGTATKYYWGDELNDSYAWSARNSKDTTHPVGETEPNGYGLYDMLGNVNEWVRDCYYNEWYKMLPDEDPVNDRQANCSVFGAVIRGGGYPGDAWDLRVSARDWAPVDKKGRHIGFRCVADAD